MGTLLLANKTNPATIKSWNIKNAEKIAQKLKDKYYIEIITNKKELTAKKTKALNPEYIFFLEKHLRM